jgi:bifunctional aspartokinase / homoserine dehydrogenase 1
MNWQVHKFGGTSVQNAECMARVMDILNSTKTHRLGVVVSAMNKVTDKLIQSIEDAGCGGDDFKLRGRSELRDRHLEAASALLGPQSSECAQYQVDLEKDLDTIQNICQGVQLARDFSAGQMDLVSGFGELWSARLLTRALNCRCPGSAEFLDAREVLLIEHLDTGAVPLWKQSQTKFNDWLEKTGARVVVITGFIARLANGTPSTLKRNGSDYSAAIFGKMFHAQTVVIWTDVDGVLSADPRLVPEAVVLEELSYQEATELAYFGAKVLHPSTMSPLIESNIPILIKNTFKPGLPGTRIHGSVKNPGLVRGIASIDQVSVINIEGTGMMGVPGVAHRLFGALREIGVSVIMISQASSEHSICFVVPKKDGDRACEAASKAFEAEIHHGKIQSVEQNANCAILAIVGEGMVHKQGVAARFFGALGRVGINVKAIAQGSSERNISLVVDAKDIVRALRTAHAAFYLSHQTVSIGVIGTGAIGKAFLKQLQLRQQALKDSANLDFRVRAIMDSKQTRRHDQELNLAEWPSAVAVPNEEMEVALENFSKHVKGDYIPHCVIVDCSASQEVANCYPKWLGRGINVVTPNKKASSSTLELYQSIKAAEVMHQSQYFYEATVGAGLPIISTLKDLRNTGDQILQIEGVLSGTLSFLFNQLEPKGLAFSEVVELAKAKGYTEPDPRDDLSGLDVARKLIILAREMGVMIELSQIEIMSLVPPALKSVGSADEFLRRLPEFDGEMNDRLVECEKTGSVLRYVGSVNASGQASVTLKAYPRGHIFASLTGADNIIAFTTSRYHAQPLVVRGPGAGPEVTAAGVFADLLRLSAQLGARA